MKMLKKTGFRIAALLLALALAAQLVPLKAEAVSFPDVKKGDWFAEPVTTLAELGILNGKEDGYFHPNDRLKRGEFIKMLTIAGEYLISTTPLQGDSLVGILLECLKRGGGARDCRDKCQ